MSNEEEAEGSPQEADFTDYSHASGKTAYYIVGYFLLCAPFAILTERLHMGMIGIFYALGAGGLIGAVILLIILGIRRKIRRMGLSKGEWTRFLLTGNPDAETTIEAEGYAVNTDSPAVTRRLDLVASSSQAFTPTRGDTASLEEHLQNGTLPDAILQPGGLYLGETFMPEIGLILAATVLFCGIRRSGKSNGIGVLAEELSGRGLPLLVCDTDDEYGGLANRRYLPRGFWAGNPELVQFMEKASPAYLPVTCENAEEIGWQLLEDNLQIVLNLKSYETYDEAALVMAGVIKGMYKWESERPNQDRVPAFVMLDEANMWLPENEAEKVVRKETLYVLQHAFFNLLVRRGGKQGLGLALATQRISELDKRALQSQWKFLFLQTDQNDIARYAALGLEKDEVVGLQQGECFTFNPLASGYKFQMRMRFSPHLGSTPGMASLKKHHRRQRPIEQVAFAGRTYDFSPIGYPQRPWQSAETGPSRSIDIPQPPKNQEPAPLTALQQRVLEAYHAGQQTHRAVGAYLRANGSDISDDRALRTLHELEALRLIKLRRRVETMTQ